MDKDLDVNTFNFKTWIFMVGNKPFPEQTE